jgi:DNA-binding CsgD family transcriptional regulator
MIRCNSVDISDELIVERWERGVRLVRPDQHCHHNEYSCTVSAMLRLPVNFYFMNGDSILMKINERTAQTCGYVSRQDAIGKSVRNVSKRATAQYIIKNDREIVCTQSFKVTTETYTRLDDVDLTAISIKFPWYANENLVGILGCSILMGYDDAVLLTDAITLLMQTGLLAPPHQATHLILPGWQCDTVYFNQREADILYHLVRGKTAKTIARIVGVSHRTVEHRLEQIKIKLGVSSKSELIEKVIDQFITKNGPEGS